MGTTLPALHPRPQLARPDWIDLRGTWEFCYDDDGRGLDERRHTQAAAFDRRIEVPFPPESPASGIGETGYHPRVWYRRAFTLPARAPGRRVLLHFGAVDYRADVWVDGQHIVSHEGGHTPFWADITAALQSGPDHVLVVRAEDDPLDMAQPRGKQDWRAEPHGIWYHRTTGIWQPVWLEVVGPTFIEELRWTPDLSRLTLGLEMRLRRHGQTPVQARVLLRLQGKVLADDRCLVEGTSFRREFAVDLQTLGLEPAQVVWGPDHPNLVEATITLLEGERTLDLVESYAGIRSVAAGQGRFWLNGSPLFLRLALEQGYWPATHLAAPSDQALREEVELAKSLGFNGVRVHQKIEDPRFLYWCDRLGLLVWGEMPSVFGAYDLTAAARLTREWLDVLRRDHSHPCIVAWVPLNESWGVPNLVGDAAQRSFVQALYHLTHALDSTRPVIGNDGWELVVGDIHGIHDYTFNGETITERYGNAEAMDRSLRAAPRRNHLLLLPGAAPADQPVMITEFGGLSYRPAQGEAWFGYGTVETPEALEQKYAELVKAIVASPAVAGFCYTQLTDTRQETNGLATEDRVPKLDARVIRAITSWSPPTWLVPRPQIETEHAPHKRPAAEPS